MNRSLVTLLVAGVFLLFGCAAGSEEEERSDDAASASEEEGDEQVAQVESGVSRQGSLPACVTVRSRPTIGGASNLTIRNGCAQSHCVRVDLVWAPDPRGEVLRPGRSLPFTGPTAGPGSARSIYRC
jgi:hypothetical protein